MSERQKEIPQGNARRAGEMGGFLLISVLGIFALGNGLTGLFEVGKTIDLLWLAVSVGAMMILWAQMRRVKDTWPHHGETKIAQIQHTIDSETALSSTQEEER